jgi:transcriptional regulator with XRE-family HTH domain
MGAANRRFKDKFQEFIADDERRRLYERESLAFDAAEMISHLMEECNVSKAELARRIGKSRSEVTQLLNGTRNMTVYSLADLAFALGYRLEFKARQHRPEESRESKCYALYRFVPQGLKTPYINPEHAPGNRIRPNSLGA